MYSFAFMRRTGLDIQRTKNDDDDAKEEENEEEEM